MTISIVIMEVNASVVTMHVTVSSHNFIVLFSKSYPFFIKLTRKHQKVEGIKSNLHFTTLVNMLPKLRYVVSRI